MPPTNRALWLKAKQDPVMVIDEAPYTPPATNEVVIRTRAVAMNPADWILQRTGLLLETYPAILGLDAAGIVEEVGADLTSQFKPGDRVFGMANLLTGYKCAAFQDYVILSAPQLAKIPDKVAFSDAVVLPLAIFTASTCLFPKEMLGLEMPPSQAGNGKTLLIWGASSSVGSCGVQLATAAGYEVFGIASAKNHSLLKSIGAAQCFDYKDSNLIPSILKALEGKMVVGAYDAISEESTLHTLCEILDQCGGRKVIAAVKRGVEAHAKLDVAIRTNFTVDMATSGIDHIWQSFLPAALAAGTFQYKPDADIVGHGLEDVQKAVDLLAEGVSAKKLVVTL